MGILRYYNWFWNNNYPRILTKEKTMATDIRDFIRTKCKECGRVVEEDWYNHETELCGDCEGDE